MNEPCPLARLGMDRAQQKRHCDHDAATLAVLSAVADAIVAEFIDQLRRDGSFPVETGPSRQEPAA